GIDWRRHTVTATGQVIGSLPWSSPEQAAGHSGKVDARADVYALGVCLYEALTGRLPLPSVGGVREALDHICNTPPEPLGTARRRLRPHASRLVLLAPVAAPAARRGHLPPAHAEQQHRHATDPHPPRHVPHGLGPGGPQPPARRRRVLSFCPDHPPVLDRRKGS